MSENKIGVYNPMTEDFEYLWKDDNNKPHILKIPANQFVYFNESQGKYMIKHLSDAIMNKEGYECNPELQRKRIIELITADAD
jgi:hypothetical protein